MNISKETLIRTILTFIALLNIILTMFGKNPLPWSEDEIYVGISAVASFLTTAWSWWKNNSFTKAAIKADEYLNEIKKSQESEKKNGVIPDNPSIRLYDYEIVAGNTAEKDYPAKFTLSRTASVKNQGDVAACCGCAMATISEYLWKNEFSEGWNYGVFRKHKGKGLYVMKALDLWKKIGAVPLADFGLLYEMPKIQELAEKYPELLKVAENYRISGYASIGYADKNKKDRAIKDALTQRNVALLAISNDYFGECHAIALDGWNDEKDVYTIQNSWGDKWGSGGYGEIPKDEIDEIYAIFVDDVSFPFNDVEEGRWSQKAIMHMLYSGLMNGTSENAFEPEKAMTREELATVIDRLCKKIDDRFERLYDIINSDKG